MITTVSDRDILGTNRMFCPTFVPILSRIPPKVTVFRGDTKMKRNFLCDLGKNRLVGALPQGHFFYKSWLMPNQFNIYQLNPFLGAFDADLHSFFIFSGTGEIACSIAESIFSGRTYPHMRAGHSFHGIPRSVRCSPEHDDDVHL